MLFILHIERTNIMSTQRCYPKILILYGILNAIGKTNLKYSL